MRRSCIINRLIIGMAAAICLIAASCHSTKSSIKYEPVTSLPTKKTDSKKSANQNTTAEADIADIKLLLSEAKKWLGTPYRYGGHDRKGTDCSGFVMEIFRTVLNEALPRASREQHKHCAPIKSDKMMPGDLVFFATGGDPSTVSHVGLYIGNNEMIHASTSKGVIISNLSEKYYSNRYLAAGRTAKVEKLYANQGKKNERSNKKNEMKENRQPEFVTQQAIKTPEQKAAEINDADKLLDSMITEKMDSIFSGFFD